MKQYALTQMAEAELGAILDYVAEHDGVDRALHVHGEFVTAFERLTESPRIGAVKAHLTSANVRWWAVFNFLVVYDAEAEPLTVVRVLHGARDVERLIHET